MTFVCFFRLGLLLCYWVPPTARWSDKDYQVLLERRQSIKGQSPAMKKYRQDSHDKAVKLGDRMIAKYCAIQNLSFQMKTVVLSEGEKKWRDLVEARIACQPKALVSSVTVNGKPVYWFFLKEGRLKQFKAPWNGAVGQKTETAYVGPNASGAYKSDIFLTAGISENMLCNLARTLHPWVGKDNLSPAVAKENFIDRYGICVEPIKSADGEEFDVILVEAIDDPFNTLWNHDQWDAFYLNKDRLLAKRVTVLKKMAVIVSTYYDFDQKPISPEVFSPPHELLKQSASWEELSEKGAMDKYLKDLER